MFLKIKSLVFVNLYLMNFVMTWYLIYRSKIILFLIVILNFISKYNNIALLIIYFAIFVINIDDVKSDI